MLRFEHLIQINDPLVPLLTPLSREEVWRGLFIRAHHPTEFVMGLETCVIESETVEDGKTTLTRTLDFGPFQVHDQVTLIPMQEVNVIAHATELWPRSQALVRIEEPEPNLIFLRFIYELAQEEGQSELDQTTEGLRKQAYLAADMDTVQRIRELAENGKLLH